MPKISVKAGTTSKLLDVFIQDSSSTVGAGLVSVAYNTSGISAYYYREGAGSSTSITLATMTLGTWATGGFIVMDGTGMPGMYQLGIPDAAIAAGAKSVVVYIKGVANMAPLVLEIELTAVDNQDSARFGMTALPNAVPGATGGVFIAGTNAATTVTTSFTTTFTGNLTGSVASVTGAVGSVTGLTASNLDTTISSRMATYTQPTGFLAATFPTGTVANTTNITAGTIANLTNAPTTGDFTATMKASITTAATAATPTISSVSGSVGSVVGNVGGSVDSVTNGVTVTTNSDKTGYALTSGERDSVSDALLARNVSGGSSTGRTVKQAFHVLRNKTAIAGGTLTVYDTDDSTTSFTAAVTTTAGDPISSIDPA